MKRLSGWSTNKYIICIIHILFWMVLFVPFSPGRPQPDRMDQFKYIMFVHNCFLLVLFYWNAYFLYPRFYKKKALLKYTLAVVFSMAFLICLSSYVETSWMHPPDFPAPGRPPGPMHLPVYIFIIGISFSYRLLSDQNMEEKKRKEQETENLKTELNFLRSQISPHFMFNILNTLVAMARKKSDLMEPSLIQLSTLMRYVLQESNYSRVPLQKELEYLKTYVELQSLRFAEDLNLQMDMAPYTGSLTIEPMLLIPFVENAFKHGMIGRSASKLVIVLQFDEELSELQFRVENPIAPIRDSKDDSSGIGLKNVSRRLELLYKDRHTLDTGEKNKVFVADLKIQFA
jgi:two-component system LytT family sensor kinase